MTTKIAELVFSYTFFVGGQAWPWPEAHHPDFQRFNDALDAELNRRKSEGIATGGSVRLATEDQIKTWGLA